MAPQRSTQPGSTRNEGASIASRENKAISCRNREGGWRKREVGEDWPGVRGSFVGGCCPPALVRAIPRPAEKECLVPPPTRRSVRGARRAGSRKAFDRVSAQGQDPVGLNKRSKSDVIPVSAEKKRLSPRRERGALANRDMISSRNEKVDERCRGGGF